MTPCAVASVYFGALIDVAVAAAFVFGYYNIMRIENAHEMIVTESPSWFPASADSARQSFYCPAVNVAAAGTSINMPYSLSRILQGGNTAAMTPSMILPPTENKRALSCVD